MAGPNTATTKWCASGAGQGCVFHLASTIPRSYVSGGAFNFLAVPKSHNEEGILFRSSGEHYAQDRVASGETQ